MPIVKKTLSEVSPAIRAAFQKAQDVLSKNSLDYGIELLKEITKKDPGFLDSRIMLRKAEKTKYAHMNKIYVKKGDHVDYNTALGEVGSTGRSTGPHLHYEVLYQGRPVDPMPFIKAKKS